MEYKRNECYDKTLVKFIIDIAQRSDTVEAFDQALKKNGVEIPKYFVMMCNLMKYLIWVLTVGGYLK